MHARIYTHDHRGFSAAMVTHFFISILWWPVSALRTTAEGLRTSAEGVRTTAEGVRTSAEGVRTTAEVVRTTAEALLMSALLHVLMRMRISECTNGPPYYILYTSY